MLKETLHLPRKEEMIPIHLTLWRPDGEVCGMVHLSHGMAEHIERYHDLALFLSSQGFVVAGCNHRGHGSEWPQERLGHFADRGGWDKVIGDLHDVMRYLKSLYPHVPYILLGHSMGSFTAREFALRYPKELDGLVLSGTGFYPKALCTAGALIAGLFPPRKPAPVLDKIVFSGNNKPFEPARTPFDWLSRDEQQVDKYIADDRCGFLFTGRAYRDFFGGLARLADDSRLSVMPATLPVYFLSGAQDPVGQMGKGVHQVADSYAAAGLQNITVHLYPGGRHEMFNEINKDEVLNRLYDWLSAHFPFQ